VLSIFPRYQVRIYREADEAYASGPLTCTGPFQDPGRGFNIVFKRYVFVKFQKQDILITIG
jgi:hypothetical protein